VADGPPRARVSAGILLFRQTASGIEVLLGHPGGPYFEHRDMGIWSIPKGEVEDGEDLWSVARREFGEETGHVLGSAARTIELGSVTQRGGKVVHAWAVEGNLDPAVCLGPWGAVREKALGVLRRAGGRDGHVFNLGHGVLPSTPPETLQRLVDLVHEKSERPTP